MKIKLMLLLSLFASSESFICASQTPAEPSTESTTTSSGPDYDCIYDDNGPCDMPPPSHIDIVAIVNSITNH